MIDGLYSANTINTQNPQNGKILQMVKNERMGGYVPKWVAAKPEDAKTQNTVEFALSNVGDKQPLATSENILAFNHSNIEPQTNAAQASEEFSFGDLIDMVNPLHHIPVVGHVYREISGDTIKPIGNIIGGAVFGGPMGVASGLINTVIQEETGKDVTGNAMAMMLRGEVPSFDQKNDLPDSPEIRLAEAQASAPEFQATLTKDERDGLTSSQSDIPGNLLAFVDLSAKTETIKREITIERINAGAGRTAGEFTKRNEEISDIPFAYREPITQVRFSGNN